MFKYTMYVSEEKLSSNQTLIILIFLTVCEDCDMEYPGDCPVHGPLIIVEDTKVNLTDTCQYQLPR